MMFRCISNLEIKQDEIASSDRVLTRDERQATEENREAEFPMQTPDAISDDEEEPTLLTQTIISTPSQHALGKRRRSTASGSDIEGNDEIPLPFMQAGGDTQMRMATRNRPQKRLRREDDDSILY
jgi:hypothetical protein